jgi:aminoglycoside/choline kinase family phosphotransferase
MPAQRALRHSFCAFSRLSRSFDMERQQQIRTWLAAVWPGRNFTLEPASADASFRRYFRITSSAETYIVMDAPPEQEDCRPFVKVAALMREAGVNAPDVLAQDLSQGFLLLTDLGRQTYLDVINDENADKLFREANTSLIKWQLASKPGVLPVYGETQIAQELALFPDWYIAQHVGATLTDKQRNTLQSVFAAIAQHAISQTKVYVHSDYMPRNLMISTPNPGVLDFQDAVYGPISYDIASLYRDAFISWEEERVLDGTIRYWENARNAGLPMPAHFGDFYRDVEWMGLQRHLRILGIFARLNYRDGKTMYLADTPRFVNYVRKTSERYGALRPLLRLFDELKIGDAAVEGYRF